MKVDVFKNWLREHRTEVELAAVMVGVGFCCYACGMMDTNIHWLSAFKQAADNRKES